MKIQDIKPIAIWSEGNYIDVVKLGVKISNDDMVQEAAFQYSLFTEQDVPLTGGFVNIKGEDYKNWGSTGNPNQEAIVWVADKINVELV